MGDRSISSDQFAEVRDGKMPKQDWSSCISLNSLAWRLLLAVDQICPREKQSPVRDLGFRAERSMNRRQKHKQ